MSCGQLPDYGKFSQVQALPVAAVDPYLSRPHSELPDSVPDLRWSPSVVPVRVQSDEAGAQIGAVDSRVHPSRHGDVGSQVIRRVGDSAERGSAPVLLCSEGLEVPRVDARPVAAEVVKLEPEGDGAYQQLVCQPMSQA
jgi:hypothetical protein